MKKSTLWVIISLMSVALIGLVSFQFYWINNAVKLNNERFAKDVHESLVRVAHKMEKAEILQFTASNLFLEGDSAFVEENIELHIDNGDSNSKFVLKREGNKELPKISKQNLRLILESPKMREKMDTTVFYHRSNTANPETKSTEQDIHQVIELTDTLANWRMHKRKKMIDVVFKEILDYNTSHDRIIDTLLLDSLLNAELLNKGIDIKYNYAVWDLNEDSLLATNVSIPIDTKLAEYKASLFPNDLLGNSSFLLVNFPDKNQFLLKQIWITLASSFLLLLIVMFCFGYAILTIIRQKKLSEIKNDFINNMTHELKTPIATVSLACEALGENEINSDKTTFHKYLGIIRDENQRLSGHVEKVLQLATTDREGIKLNFEPIDINSLAKVSINNISLQLSQKQGVVDVDMKAENATSYVDRHHILNVINNILDNALKYSIGAPKIKITSQNLSDVIQLRIRDNGIGLSSDQTSKIFEKFYRVPTGNVHNVKGFGLGLSYAKNIIEAHKGRLKVNSELGKGSEFIIELPTI